MDTELKRVSLRISEAIEAYAKRHPGIFFCMGDLNRHVEGTVGAVAPDSPGRVLRDLRRKKRLNYRVVSRTDSLYQFMEAA